MRKRLGLIILLFIMISVFILNFGQSVKYIVRKDGEIEWQSYGGEWLG